MHTENLTGKKLQCIRNFNTFLYHSAKKKLYIYIKYPDENVSVSEKYDFTGIQFRKLLIFSDLMIYSAYYENKNQEKNILASYRSAVLGDIADRYQSESSISDAVRL